MWSKKIKVCFYVIFVCGMDYGYYDKLVFFFNYSCCELRIRNIRGLIFFLF